jgi:hypothetical protein
MNKQLLLLLAIGVIGFSGGTISPAMAGQCDTCIIGDGGQPTPIAEPPPPPPPSGSGRGIDNQETMN